MPASCLQCGLDGPSTQALFIKQLTVVEFDEAVAKVKIFLVVGDDQGGLAARSQFGQQLRVENFFEQRVLVGRPFVENVERAVFEISREQGQTLALALRERGRGERSVPHFDFVVEVQLDEVILRLGVQVGGAQTEQTFKEVKIREYGREELAIIVAILIGNQFAVETNLPGL